MPVHRDPEPPGLLLEDVEGPDGPGEQRGVGHVRQQALARQQASGLAGLFLARGGQVDVPPSREAVLEVPEALAVADQYKRRHEIKPIRPATIALGLGRTGEVDFLTI